MPEITPPNSSDSLSEPTIDTKRIYEGSIINVRVDTVRMPNGISARREVVEHSPAVCIVPVDENGNVILVRQYRKPAEEALLEVPAGGVEEGEVSELSLIPISEPTRPVRSPQAVFCLQKKSPCPRDTPLSRIPHPA